MAFSRSYAFEMLGFIIDDLGIQRVGTTVLACAAILILFILIFQRFFVMTKLQLQELEKARETI